MSSLLRLHDPCHWNVEGIEWAIPEQVGKVDAPIGFATTPGVDIHVVQMLDEFHYLTMSIQMRISVQEYRGSQKWLDSGAVLNYEVGVCLSLNPAPVELSA